MAKIPTKKRKLEEDEDSITFTSDEEDIPLVKRFKAAPANKAKSLKKKVYYPQRKLVGEENGYKAWQVGESLWVAEPPNVRNSTKVVGFDIDSTIVVPKSLKKTGKPNKFPQNRQDWKWWDPRVPGKLREIHAKGVRVVFFTNQAGIVKKKTMPDEIWGKAIDLSKAAKIPITTFISGAKDRWRKPQTDMWDYFGQEFNGGMEDKELCAYVGDAGGRPKDWRKGAKRDFSCSDRKFAANLGIRFYTPETYFLGLKPYPKFEWRSTNPITFYKAQKKKSLYMGASPTFPHEKGKLDVILMVGYPGSGKTTYCKKYMVKPYNYVWVNRDTLKTPAKCKKFLKQSLAEGKNVVVDNTNPTIKKRAEYIAIAKQFGAHVRCFWIQLEKEDAEHINAFRFKLGGARVPTIAYNIFRKNFETPTKAEGFAEVVKVNFIPEFPDAEKEKLFMQFA